MSACTCRHCGPRGVKPTTVEVTIVISVERPGWEQTGYGEVWSDEVEREHELRAEVKYGAPDDAPEVSWLDRAAVDDLELTPAELLGAEERAGEAGYEALMARSEQSEPRVAGEVYSVGGGKLGLSATTLSKIGRLDNVSDPHYCRFRAYTKAELEKPFAAGEEAFS